MHVTPEPCCHGICESKTHGYDLLQAGTADGNTADGDGSVTIEDITESEAPPPAQAPAAPQPRTVPPQPGMPPGFDPAQVAELQAFRCCSSSGHCSADILASMHPVLFCWLTDAAQFNAVCAGHHGHRDDEEQPGHDVHDGEHGRRHVAGAAGCHGGQWVVHIYAQLTMFKMVPQCPAARRMLHTQGLLC